MPNQCTTVRIFAILKPTRQHAITAIRDNSLHVYDQAFYDLTLTN